MTANGSPSEIGSILAYVDGGPGSAGVLKTAAEIGNTYQAYVEVLHIAQSVDAFVVPMDLGGSLMATTEIFEIMKQEAESRTSRAKAAFDDFCRQENITGVAPDSVETLSHKQRTIAWNLMSGNDGRDLARRGRLFDLIVMAKAADQVGGVDSVQLEAALFDSGRPVLVSGGSSDAAQSSSIVIAWDGSREAAHSVTLALPFLSKARQVHLMSVGECEPGMGIDDFGRFLKRRGISIEQCQLAPNDKSVADVLIDASLDKKAGILVMGAYGHSALGEGLFGGVTRELLEEGKISLLMAH